ncbi:NCS2 family permease [Carnobacterium divergens]|uniref:NCS2 family permease n=1 Tax=Carnobacterium divergens TaxID=2748 RepID=A0AAW8R9B4_CARDV|nr:NCS2 family permease [Carnobacterium divergens]MDT1956858.1 NCS2 family permease [Carnobacterium divergens]MDT1972828.1 NCS2 family permease [Carnobacterium divergens]
MNLFKLKEKKTTAKTEIIAGLTSFFAISYIVIVNSVILKDAGIPAELSVFATIFISAIGCYLMGIFANAPIILTPGMGVNAFFTYTLVGTLGLRWQEAIGVMMVSSLIYCVIAFSKASDVLSRAVPDTLKHGITCGIGLFLVMIGLEKGQLIVAGDKSLVALGDLANPHALLAIFGLILTLILVVRNVQGGMFIGILATTILGVLFKIQDTGEGSFSLMNIVDYPSIMGQGDFSGLFSLKFMMGVFSLTMILVFESMGLLQGLMEEASTVDFKKAFRMSAVTTFLSGIFGTSPTIAAAESASGIEEGGKTGLTTIVSGTLFLATLFFIPLLSYVPQAAIAPVILITGALMMKNLQHIQFDDFTEWFPAFLIVVLIPLTSSIADGMAAGFVFYPIVKLVSGKKSEIHPILYGISALFLMYLVLNALI